MGEQKLTALITGASSGIGEDLARLFAADGHNVVLVARSGERLHALAGELRDRKHIDASAVVADLSDPASPDRIARELAERSQPIDVLVNNAGFGQYGLFATVDAVELGRLLQVNIGALTLLTRLLLPGMLSRRSGRVLNVASTAAFQPGPLMAAYYASKAYVLSLSEALAEETRGTGVTITCLCPGPTTTRFQARAGMQKSKLFKMMSTMSSAEVALAGYRGVMSGRRLVIPGLMNKVGAHATRFAPRILPPRIVRALQSES
jgi:short-subunit dehydrogenase